MALTRAQQSALSMTTLALSGGATPADVRAALTDPFNEAGSVVAGFEFLVGVVSALASLLAGSLEAATAITDVPAETLLQRLCVDLQELDNSE